MKIWMFVILSLLSTKIFASVADSGRCPWKMPFTITISASGSNHRYELARSIIAGGWYDHNTDYGSTSATNSVSITIDSTGSYLSDSVKFSVRGSSLNYSRISKTSYFGPPANQYVTVKIIFVYGRDSIASIKISGGDSANYGAGQGFANHYDLSMCDLAIDTSNIFVTDTSFQNHKIAYTNSAKQGFYGNQYEFDQTYNDFTATSATLSGIIRPVTLGRGGMGVGCPWKIPFTIQVHASGETSSSGYFSPQMGPGTSLNSVVMPETHDLSFTIDNSYVLRNDTLRSNGEGANESIIIVFWHGVDSIRSISYTQNVSGVRTSFNIFSLLFDSTGIYTTDSSFRHHNTSFVIDRSNTDYVGRHDYISSGSRFVASNASLNGIFRPISLRDSTSESRPLSIPFRITIHSEGSLDSLHTTHQASQDISVSVWHVTPSGPDTILFSSGTPNNDTVVEIYFVPGTDSVRSFNVALSNITIYAGTGLQDQWGVYTTAASFAARDFVHDSTIIFSSDSSLCAHNIVMTSSQYHKGYDFLGFTSDTARQFTASSVDLSGIFRPTHYACEADVKQQLGCSKPLSITESPQGLACSFESSQKARTIEVYSILGIKKASYLIPAGETQVRLIDLGSGFYLVRLENEVAKVAIQ